jgi:hypothetical protein
MAMAVTAGIGALAGTIVQVVRSATAEDVTVSPTVTLSQAIMEFESTSPRLELVGPQTGRCRRDLLHPGRASP